MEGEGVESREKGAQDDISYFATVSNREILSDFVGWSAEERD